MLKELCATLLVLCNPILNGFDFDYAKDDKDQFVQGEVDVFALVDTLDSYAKDPLYKSKLKDVILSLLRDYPLLFRMDEVLANKNP